MVVNRTDKSEERPVHYLAQPVTGKRIRSIRWPFCLRIPTLVRKQPVRQQNMLRKRSRAREVAMQLLFQHDLNPGVKRPAIERFVRERLGQAELESFALSLFDGVRAQTSTLDERLGRAADNWRVARMAVVDRNVLRLGSYELLHGTDTPVKVIFDEAIEIARRYGSADSPAFVNGILDRIHKSETRPDASS
jgi:transcription antitermination protein NusB